MKKLANEGPSNALMKFSGVVAIYNSNILFNYFSELKKLNNTQTIYEF